MKSGSMPLSFNLALTNRIDNSKYNGPTGMLPTQYAILRGRVKNSLQPSFFSSHGCIYTKVAVSTSSMNLCLSCHVT